MAETRKQIDARIRERFSIFEDFTYACTTGDCRALITSGPSGLGKSFTVEKVLGKWDPTGTQYIITKGKALTTGLLKLLYAHRFPNHVIVFDDSDTIFGDEDSLNLLKAVCDTTERRVVSYRAESRLVDEDSAELIPSSFLFEGSIIFLTNLDFDKKIEKDDKWSKHISALVSRSHYIDLTMKTSEDFIVRIEQVVAEGLLDMLSKSQQKEVMDFIYANKGKLRELSLRMAIKIAHIRKMNKPNWRSIATITCCKN